MKIAIQRQVADVLGDSYRVVSSEYEDGPPFRDRIILKRKGRWFSKTKEVGYICGDEVISGDINLLKRLEKKIPGLNTQLIEWPQSVENTK